MNRQPALGSWQVVAGRVTHSKRATVEAKAHDHFLRLHVLRLYPIPPEEAKPHLDLCQIRMALEIVPCPVIVLVPETMKVIRHEIEVVNIFLQILEIKASQIPIACG